MELNRGTSEFHSISGARDRELRRASGPSSNRDLTSTYTAKQAWPIGFSLRVTHGILITHSLERHSRESPYAPIQTAKYRENVWRNETVSEATVPALTYSRVLPESTASDYDLRSVDRHLRACDIRATRRVTAETERRLKV